MKKITFYILLSVISLSLFAQKKDTGLVGMSTYLSVGLLPYGYNSIGVRSKQWSAKGDPNTSILVGLDYKVKDYKIGFFVEGSLKQNYTSTEWTPFIPIEVENQYNGTILSFTTETNSINGGLLIGGDVTEELEIFAKLGVGASFHSYSLGFRPVIGKEFYTEGTQRSLNYQIGMELKYFPINNYGVVSSWAIAENFPLFSVGVVNRF
jgi:hypothetical protein